MTSVAFCPGHITALFYAPEPGPTPETTGSRGAGVCISLGARATVTSRRADTNHVTTGETTTLAPGVGTALEEYLGRCDEHLGIHLDLELDLPVGQGFGMSGAMTFSALVAAEGELGLVDGDVRALLAHAHAAEVAHSTGLGDVVAQAEGGLDLRSRQGLPPSGRVVFKRQEGVILVAWADRPLHTRSVLSDPAARQRLRVACAHRLEGPSNGPDLDWLFRNGWAFARDAGLSSSEVESMVGLCAPHGLVSQVMLGNSVFAMGDVAAMENNLRQAGYAVRVTTVDNRGVRLLGTP
jgi:pantoate kinase